MGNMRGLSLALAKEASTSAMISGLHITYRSPVELLHRQMRAMYLCM